MPARPQLEPGATIACVAPGLLPALDRSCAPAPGRSRRTDIVRLTGGPPRRSSAGTAQERAAELEVAFGDPAVDAVIRLRGGYGSGQLLPLLDLERIAAGGKPLIGMSDITHLLVPLAAAGASCVWGPMLVTHGTAS